MASPARKKKKGTASHLDKGDRKADPLSLSGGDSYQIDLLFEQEKETGIDDPRIITRDDQVPALIDWIKTQDVLAHDLETDDLSLLCADLVGFGVSNETQGFFVFYNHQRATGVSVESVREIIKAIFSCKLLINHNLPFDLKFDAAILCEKQPDIALKTYLKASLFDTYWASFFLDQERQGGHGLKRLAADILGRRPSTFDDIVKDLGAKRCDPRSLALYCIDDCLNAFALYKYFVPILKMMNMWNVFTRLRMRLLPILVCMEVRGINMDLDLMRSSKGTFYETRSKALEEISKLYPILTTPGALGCAKNKMPLDSPIRLGKFLFDPPQEGGLGISMQMERTKTGYDTSEDHLLLVRDSDPVIKKILEYRAVQKIISTYIENQEILMSRDNKLFPIWKGAGVRTGRLACITEDCEILTNFGNILPGDLASQPDTVYLITHQNRWQKLVCAWPEPPETIYLVETEDGCKIKCTGDHRVLTPAGWSKVSELRSGDCIYTLQGYPDGKGGQLWKTMDPRRRFVQEDHVNRMDHLEDGTKSRFESEDLAFFEDLLLGEVREGIRGCEEDQVLNLFQKESKVEEGFTRGPRYKCHTSGSSFEDSTYSKEALLTRRVCTVSLEGSHPSVSSVSTDKKLDEIRCPFSEKGEDEVSGNMLLMECGGDSDAGGTAEAWRSVPTPDNTSGCTEKMDLRLPFDWDEYPTGSRWINAQDTQSGSRRFGKTVLGREQWIPSLPGPVEQYSRIYGKDSSLGCSKIERISSLGKQVYWHLSVEEDHSYFSRSPGSTGWTINGNCAMPNLMNVPKKGGIRNYVIPPPGNLFWVGDQGQLELRILTHLTGEPVYVRAFNEDLDPHLMASAIMELIDFPELLEKFGKMSEDPTPSQFDERTKLFRARSDIDRAYTEIVSEHTKLDAKAIKKAAQERVLKNLFGKNWETVWAMLEKQRDSTKTIVYGILYGATAMRVSNELKIPIADAERLMDRYYGKLTSIRDYTHKSHEFILANGYSRTEMGSIRRLSGWNGSMNQKEEAKRQGFNFEMQGFGMEIMAVVMIRIENDPEMMENRVYNLIQIHDELVVTLPKEWQEKCPTVPERIADFMRFPFGHDRPLKIPLAVDWSIKDRWSK